MTTVNRRDFLKITGTLAGIAALPRRSWALAGPEARVVIVGGGFGGATAAKYLALWGQGRVAVTLVDPNPEHTSCVLSNLVVTGLLTESRIRLSLATLKNQYGVSLVQGYAQNFDAKAKTLSVATTLGSEILDYDYLILSPGIDFVVPTPKTWIQPRHPTLGLLVWARIGKQHCSRSRSPV